jgi:G3E family GTPase
MRTRLILVGGFLGAGKTTLLLEAAHRLAEDGQRVGLVTNDQGPALVDTALARQHRLAVSEVAGGCFCCSFGGLLDSIQALQAEAQPQVILAEPVGSCTDLVATVLRPLQAYYPGQFELAPLTILVDTSRELAGFPHTVDYLYERQLAEAEVIALNKVDRMTPARAAEQQMALETQQPQAQVVRLSARTGEGVAAWLEQCLRQTSRLTGVLELDYGAYAEAEASLGWLNARGTCVGEPRLAPAQWSTELLSRLASEFAARSAAIAHMKLLVTTPTAAIKASVTEAGGPITWDTFGAEADAERAEFILNIRAAAPPQTVEHVARLALDQVAERLELRCSFTQLECFSPRAPVPTHRLA